MKSKLTILALILLAATSAAFTQTIEHAPTAEQCRADIALWKAQLRAEIISLSVRHFCSAPTTCLPAKMSCLTLMGLSGRSLLKVFTMNTS